MLDFPCPAHSATPAVIQWNAVSYEQFLNDMTARVAAVFAQKSQQEEERLLTQAAALELFVPKISRVTFHKWETAGHIVPHMIGTKKFYKRSEIIAAAKTIKKYERKPITA